MESQKSNTSTYTVRVDEDLKKAFEQCAKAMDRTGSQLIRDHMRWYVSEYMKRHAQKEIPNIEKAKK